MMIVNPAPALKPTKMLSLTSRTYGSMSRRSNHAMRQSTGHGEACPVWRSGRNAEHLLGHRAHSAGNHERDGRCRTNRQAAATSRIAHSRTRRADSRRCQPGAASPPVRHRPGTRELRRRRALCPRPNRRQANRSDNPPATAPMEHTEAPSVHGWGPTSLSRVKPHCLPKLRHEPPLAGASSVHYWDGVKLRECVSCSRMTWPIRDAHLLEPCATRASRHGEHTLAVHPEGLNVVPR